MKLGNDIRVIMTKTIVTILVEIVWPSNQMPKSMDFGSKHNKETNEKKTFTSNHRYQQRVTANFREKYHR